MAGEDQSLDQAEYELYDYRSDPRESRNLAIDHPEIVEELNQILSKYPDPVPKNGGEKSSE